MQLLVGSVYHAKEMNTVSKFHLIMVFATNVNLVTFLTKRINCQDSTFLLGILITVWKKKKMVRLVQLTAIECAKIDLAKTDVASLMLK